MNKEKFVEWLKSENPKQSSISTCNFIISLVRKIESGSFDDEDEEYHRPRFKMDANGNLTRLRD